LLAFCSAALAFGAFRLRLGSGALQTLAFVAVAFGSQATIFAIRERHHLFTRPSRWLVGASAGTVAVSAGLAAFGILMVALPWVLVGELLAAAALFGLALDAIKLPLFRSLKLS
jgi:H+-transporting ATPase